MSADEIAGYRYQLEQIEALLESDPQNSELLKLKNDLVELIALTTQFEMYKAQHDRRRPPPPPLLRHKKSQKKTHQRGRPQQQRFSSSTVLAKSGVVYSVIFAGYQDVEIVKAEDVKPIDNKNKNKRPAGNGESGGDGAKKQPQAKKAKKPAAVEVKKNAWLNFANKAEKKKKTSAIPINKKSIFKTPDNPEGKVGVIGSGRGMTDFQQRGKHQYSADSQVDEE
ncbi:unnamed protein product [Umbelopsis ramanniana]